MMQRALIGELRVPSPLWVLQRLPSLPTRPRGRMWLSTAGQPWWSKLRPSEHSAVMALLPYPPSWTSSSTRAVSQITSSMSQQMPLAPLVHNRLSIAIEGDINGSGTTRDDLELFATSVMEHTSCVEKRSVLRVTHSFSPAPFKPIV